MLYAMKAALKSLPPLRRAARSVSYTVGSYQEKEIALLAFIESRGKIAIDVGASVGGYTHILLKLGLSVVAIEANPKMVAILTQLYGRKARIVCAAASSSSGSVKLRIPRALPTGSHGIATVEVRNTLNGAEVDEIEVPQVTLDGMKLESVGFIKVDVEGHEFDVLLGAKKILERDRPAILVEVEERHRPGAIQSIRELLSPLGYHGFMLDDGRLSSISNFDAARDQFIPADRVDDLNAGTYKGRYINNFIFLA
jgi:FkbM family methyltransferase